METRYLPHEQGFDPYRAPQSGWQPEPSDNCWREGKKVFVPAGQDLPHYCIRCGSEADGQSAPQKFYWHHPALYLVLLSITVASVIGLILYWILAVILRKKVLLTPQLCHRHRRLRTLTRTVSVLLLLGLIALCAGSLYAGTWGLLDGQDNLQSALVLFGILDFCALFGLAVYHSMQILYLSKVEPEYAVVKNFGRGFLERIPLRG